MFLILNILNPDSKFLPQNLLYLIPFGFFMILGEELGWRGFLQDSLKNLTEVHKWIILGLMWEFWHFSRGLTQGALPQLLVKKLIMIVLPIIITIIIGKLTDKTKSLMVAISLHTWLNIQFEYPHINTQVTAIIMVIVWGLLIWKWNKNILPK